MAEETYGPWQVTVGTRTTGLPANPTYRINGVETVQTDHDIPDGSTVTVEAVAPAGWTFVKWEFYVAPAGQEAGYVFASDSASYSFTACRDYDMMPGTSLYGRYITLYASFAETTTGRLLHGASGTLIYGAGGGLLYRG